MNTTSRLMQRFGYRLLVLPVIAMVGGCLMTPLDASLQGDEAMMPRAAYAAAPAAFDPSLPSAAEALAGREFEYTEQAPTF